MQSISSFILRAWVYDLVASLLIKMIAPTNSTNAIVFGTMKLFRCFESEGNISSSKIASLFGKWRRCINLTIQEATLISVLYFLAIFNEILSERMYFNYTVYLLQH